MIAVGMIQNIIPVRGSSSEYMKKLIDEKGAKVYELVRKLQEQK